MPLVTDPASILLSSTSTEMENKMSSHQLKSRAMFTICSTMAKNPIGRRRFWNYHIEGTHEVAVSCEPDAKVDLVVCSDDDATEWFRYDSFKSHKLLCKQKGGRTAM
mmetsp:Transcript_18328/g.26325  ORF Transcript_18328/g.26325 Transcript_18328/m.26325 type:complete len:107 (-) Transcript_18328:474-794(-)